jgi:hypothetical protein
MDWSRERSMMARSYVRPHQKQESVPSLRIQRLNAIRPGLMPRLVPTAQVAPQHKSQHVPLYAALHAALHNFSVVDRAVIATGIMMAVASASFATYMVASDHSHPQFSGVEHLMIFARQSHNTPAPIIARTGGGPAEDPGVDYTATGSIPETAHRSARPNYTLPSVNPQPEDIIKDLTLRGVSGNVAVVEGPEGVYRLKVGSELPGGGRVLGIEWRDGTFVVVTTRGVIREEQP